MKLADKRSCVQHRLSPRSAEVAADAQYGLQRAARLHRRRLAGDRAATSPTPISCSCTRATRAPPHPARRCSIDGTGRTGGGRHQCRHLRAVEGHHAQRRGAAPLQVGRRRQYRRQRAGLRILARCCSSRPIRWRAARHSPAAGRACRARALCRSARWPLRARIEGRRSKASSALRACRCRGWRRVRSCRRWLAKARW